LFFSQNADASLRKGDADTALLAALRGDKRTCVQALVSQGSADSLNAVDKKGQTPLHLAAITKQLHYLELLLAQGAEVDPIDELLKTTPLALAVKSGELEMVKLLLDHGAKPGFKYGPNGLGPLHLAAASLVSLEIAELLLSYGLDVNATASDGSCPLHHAAANGSLPMVELLLKKGASSDVLDGKGRTPFVCACAASAIGCVTLLIERGSGKKIGLKDERGVTPLVAAIKEGAQEVFELLLSNLTLTLTLTLIGGIRAPPFEAALPDGF